MALGYNQLGSYFKNRDELDSAYFYRKATLDIVTELQNIGAILTANTQFAILHSRENNFEAARDYLYRNIHLFENKDTIATAREVDFKYIGSSYHQLSQINLQQGMFNLALKDQLKALELYKERADDPLFEADSYTTLGEIEMKLENFEQSLIYFNQALKVYREFEDLLWECEALIFIGENLIYLDQPEKALEHFLLAIQIANENHFQLKEARAYNLLGNAYMELAQYPKGLQSLTKSLEIFNQMQNPTEIHSTYVSLGLIYNKMEQPKLAISYLDKAITISDSLKTTPQASKAYFARHQSFRQLKDHYRALEDFEVYNKLNDSIFSTKKSQQIEEMRAIFELEKKEQQIAQQETELVLYEQKEKVSRLQKWLLSSGLGLSVLVFGLGFYGLRQKIKRNKLEKEKIDAELAFKKKELTTHALHLAKKNETLENLKLKAKELKEKEKGGLGYQQLISAINFDLKDDNNWENFARYFEEVHKDFNLDIIKKYPEVTPSELRLMALLKMNLSSKEIANILNISNAGVKKARNRLRKKLNIAPEDSLEALIISM